METTGYLPISNNISNKSNTSTVILPSACIFNNI